MPLYSFLNPKTQESKEIFFHMNEEKIYKDENGLEWTRIWTVPQASFSTILDPFSQQQFIDKTGRGNDTVGSLWDRSAELSAKRAEICGGKDEVKQKFYDNYAATRKGKRNIKEIKEKIDKATFTI